MPDHTDAYDYLIAYPSHPVRHLVTSVLLNLDNNTSTILLYNLILYNMSSFCRIYQVKQLLGLIRGVCL